MGFPTEPSRCDSGRSRPGGILDRLRGEEGAELVEFTVVFLVLIVLSVAVGDFGRAWALRDKLSNAVRDGARVAISVPNDVANPQCGSAPCSVQVAASAAVQYLTNAAVNVCGMAPASTPPSQGSGFSWTYTSSGSGCTNQWTLKVERALPVVSSGTTVLCTRVTISYPYTWSFARVVKLIAPTSNFATTLTLTTADTTPNLN
jgi:Flp pilus assembly protein TadG